MTIGDLFDLLEEKLKIGEFNRMDSIQIIGNDQGFFECYPVEDLVKAGHDTVQIEIDGYIGEFPAVIGESDEDDDTDELKGEIEALREVIEEADEYLDDNKLNTIGSMSAIHREFKRVLQMVSA